MFTADQRKRESYFGNATLPVHPGLFMPPTVFFNSIGFTEFELKSENFHSPST